MIHKHADLIIAWANGAPIQKQNIDGKWLDDDYPYWYPHLNYRVKPETVKYRVALFKRSDDVDGHYILTYDESDEYPPEKDKDFVRWITDWIEVEV